MSAAMARHSGGSVLELSEAGAMTGIIRGYASLFGAPDMAGDVIERGAFRASLERRAPGAVRMLWQHEPGRPIGVWTAIAEDGAGLSVEGRLALETRGGAEAFALIRAGAVDGLSIGFRTRRARKEGAGGHARRRLLEIDLWEISVVTFPMQERARLSDVKEAAVLAARLRAGAERVRAGALAVRAGIGAGAGPASACG